MGGEVGAPGQILLDACCVLNLYATGRMEAILRALPLPCAVAERVVAEALHVRRGGDGEDADERDPVDLAPLIAQGLIEVLRLETDEEAASFVGFAAQLDDGEAMTCALALHRDGVVGTDDRKARRVCGMQEPPLEIQTTPTMLKAWGESGQIASTELKQALFRIRERARFAPGKRDPLQVWWEAALR
jgi:predicted nucleic acid-binding protein